MKIRHLTLDFHGVFPSAHALGDTVFGEDFHFRPPQTVEWSGRNTYEAIRDAVLTLPKGDQARIPALVAGEVNESYPGIDFTRDVCGGAARIIRTRIPVWTLEVARRQGMSDGAILASYPSLVAEDLANAWAYARSHRTEIDQKIAANEDLFSCRQG